MKHAIFKRNCNPVQTTQQTSDLGTLLFNFVWILACTSRLNLVVILAQFLFSRSLHTLQVDAQEKKKKKTGRAKRRMQYNRRFVNVVATFGRRRGPNSNAP